MYRRQFLAGVLFTSCRLLKGADRGAGAKRMKAAGIRPSLKTIDMHAHCLVPEALELVGSYPWAAPLKSGLDNPAAGRPMNLKSVDERLRTMDEWGIDIQALSINPFWYAAERDVATELIRLQNERVAALCAAHPDRFVGLASVALQFPDLAAQQLEDGVKKLGMRGCMIGGSVNGAELSAPQFNPFWAKAEELGVVVFIHPQIGSLGAGMTTRMQGNGMLAYVIGHPLETTLALSHLIWEGTLDRYPGLKICAAHGGGYLPSYFGRTEACLDQINVPGGCKPSGKRPRDYIRQLYFDSLVFTAEGLRHLVAEVGASQIVIGTDYPLGWTSRPIEHILDTPGLSRSEREAMLGGTAAKLLRIG